MNATTEKKAATAISPIADIRNTLTTMRPQFARALPKTIEPEKFLRVVETAISTNESLMQADRKSLFAACTRAAQDGLLPDGREGALVEFNVKNKAGTWDKKVQWMPMVQGIVKLARNSGEVSSITSEVVYKNDKFTYRIGIDDMPIHEPDWFGENRGEPIGVWAVVTLKDGEKISRILPKSKVMTIAGKTKNANQYDPKTGAYFDEWWRKTAIKNVLKYAPRSTELDRIIKAENELLNEPDTPEDSGFDDEVTTEAKKPAPVAKGSSRLNAIKQANKVVPEPEAEAENEGQTVEGEYTHEDQDEDRI